VKAMNDRTATAQDVEQNLCVFYVPDGGSQPYFVGNKLPIPARIATNDLEHFANGSHVYVVQAEQLSDGTVLFGIVKDDGEEGLCRQDEVELLGES